MQKFSRSWGYSNVRLNGQAQVVCEALIDILKRFPLVALGVRCKEVSNRFVCRHLRRNVWRGEEKTTKVFGFTEYEWYEIPSTAWS